MTVVPITTTDALAAFCDSQADSSYITVDTEFVRESTYYPQLCLVQVAGESDAAAIDTLAEGLDLEPLFALLRKPDLLKVFHAARQDLEIFYTLMGAVPAPVFDTQVAAMVLGFGDQVGYEVLVNKILGHSLDKSSRFTDWSRRPLTDRQIDYAMADVDHLRPIYEELQGRLDENGRAHWLTEEMKILTAEDTYRNDPDTAWKRLKARGLKPRALAVLHKVAAWREREAQRRNTPRNRVVRDDTVLDIAGSMPTTADDLRRIRGLGKNIPDGRIGQEILAAVKEAVDIPREDLPKVKRREQPPPGVAPTMELLKVLLKAKCDQEGIASRLIATADDLEKLAMDDEADVQALKGWRRELFGEDALNLKHGRLALTVGKSSVKIMPVSDV
ncbi:ribonuclease D [Hwanghaeella grinnelliae]|uniref:Ribonuclease D n=1 Tax=Hwanghaeella grinnelliae TaxID=2500179 RepID=A0A3S2VS67_9PROT|nr:ribonuclease D [Hwanghaeella grinnelliae]RVU38499.1 ribonuclease D [Hwanghaeella grinnelliae]